MTAPALAPAIVVVPQHSHSAARSFFVNVGNAIQSGAQAVGRAFGRAWAWISNAFTSHVLPFIRTTATFVKDFFRDVFVRFKVDPGFRRALIIGSLGTAAVIALVALTALGIKALVNRKKEEKPAAPAAAAGYTTSSSRSSSSSSRSRYTTSSSRSSSSSSRSRCTSSTSSRRNSTSRNITSSCSGCSSSGSGSTTIKSIITAANRYRLVKTLTLCKGFFIFLSLPIDE
jgi:hypothetical protein